MKPEHDQPAAAGNRRLVDNIYKRENQEQAELLRVYRRLYDMKEPDGRDEGLQFGVLRPSEALNAHREEVREVIAGYDVVNPRVFGSVLRGTDTVQSDLNILVEPGLSASLLDIAEMQARLKCVLNVRVDVVTPNALPESCRDDVLNDAEPV
ncbi:nucleotidyltransferase family protein [Lautropia dentalis]|uniref:nucleotidyltransferase family protein n=1 Tax=Lautropia dentalis TaxID=2490857 RepID=UPI0026AD2730